MTARKRKTLAVRLFDEHRFCAAAIEAAAFARLEAARRLSLNSQDREHQRAAIQRMFREGRKLLGWLSQPSDMDRRDRALVRVLSLILTQPKLTAKFKADCIRTAPRRPRGRPPERKLRAVYALETKLARPEATWEEITACSCPCTKRDGHDECCIENLESEVKRLKSVLRALDLIPSILADATHTLLKRNLQEMFSQKG